MFPDWVAGAECETGRPQNVGPAGGTRVRDTEVQHLGACQRPHPGAGAFSRTSGRSFGRNARSSYDAHATGVLGTLLPFPDPRSSRRRYRKRDGISAIAAERLSPQHGRPGLVLPKLFSTSRFWSVTHRRLQALFLKFSCVTTASACDFWAFSKAPFSRPLGICPRKPLGFWK